MNIIINVTSQELNETGFDRVDLAEFMFDAIDSQTKEMPGFNIQINVDGE